MRAGDFENNEFQGQGVYTWSDGGSYNGMWVQGNMCGKGTRTHANGTVYKGTSSVEAARRLVILHRERLFICVLFVGAGMFANDRRNGKGTETRENGDYWECTWKDNEPSGSGKGKRTYIFRQ